MVFLTREQVRLIDRIAIEKYHIPGIVLMENAARGTSKVVLDMLRGKSNQDILILCGGGNNGGDGLATARHLHNHRQNLVIGIGTDPSRYQGDALINWRIIEAMNLPRLPWQQAFTQMPSPHLIIDAIFGTGLRETPRSPFPEIVKQLSETQSPVLSIDLPSGLDCDTGKPLGPCIRATRTVTFVAEKIGFRNPGAKEFTGEVTVADIGCPREAIDEAIMMRP
jgi:NAD(P)H-hydrate epimerase